MVDKAKEKKIFELIKSESGINKAFKLLVTQYGQQLYWHIRKMVINHSDTDDILQNTFIKAYSAIYTFRGESTLFTWLYRIATNETLSFLDKKKRQSVNINNLHEYNNEILYTDNEISGDQIQRKLQQAIQLLPEKQRLVFNMKYFDNLKYTEISKILDTGVGALKTSYHLAVKKIEEYLNNND